MDEIALMIMHHPNEHTLDRNTLPIDDGLGACVSSARRDDRQGSSEDLATSSATTLVRMVEGLAPLQTSTLGVREICIAVLDGAVDRTHPVLRGSALRELGSYLGEAAPPVAATTHGTAVSSLLFGQPGSALQGVAPGCQGLLIPIFPYDEQGKLLPCSQLELAKAILLAVSAGAHVINISGGQLLAPSAADPLLENAVAECQKKGVLIIAAAGNDACACTHLPAAFSWVLVVGAMDQRGVPLMASNWGEEYRTHGILAPGQDIPVALPDGVIGGLSGTSMAAPIVSGVAGLLLSLQYTEGRALDPPAVRRALLDSARRCQADELSDCRRYLAGSLDVTSAWQRIKPSSENTEREMLTHPPSYNGIVMSTIESNSRDQFQFEPTSNEANLLGNDADLLGNDPALLGSVSAAITAQGGVGPSTCSECSKESADDDRSGPAKVYVLGTIGYDFISDARHDSLAQAMGVKEAGQVSAFLRHLESHPHIAASVIWTVELDSTPIYAVIPTGPYATSIYDRLIAILRAQEAGMINRVSIPGIASVSSIRTRSGQALTALFPELIGMYGWTTEGLVTSVCGPRPKEDGCNDRHEEKKSYDKKAQRVHQFLERVYYELRNLGITPQDRALNFAATNAHQVEQIYVRALSESLELDKIDVVKSPVARPGSDSWDVKMTFFQPKQRLERAKVEYRFTVDVTDVIPLIRGPVREWSVY